MSAITTHVLNTATGRPGASIAVVLEEREGDGWRFLAAGRTDSDGRLRNLLAEDHRLAVGDYRLTFDTIVYFERLATACFYPEVRIAFTVSDPGQHYHVPLLISPFGYSTYFSYRGDFWRPD